jgi:hypothetical protein
MTDFFMLPPLTEFSIFFTYCFALTGEYLFFEEKVPKASLLRFPAPATLVRPVRHFLRMPWPAAPLGVRCGLRAAKIRIHAQFC